MKVGRLEGGGGFEDSRIRGAGGKKLPEAYLYGCDLYNHGYWWEAHEAWEDIWQQTDKTRAQGRFLQTLIQVSACHLKLFGKNIEGVRALNTRSETHVRAVLDELGEQTVFMGLDVGRWYEQVRGYYDRVLTAGEQDLSHDPETYPYVVLER